MIYKCPFTPLRSHGDAAHGAHAGGPTMWWHEEQDLTPVYFPRAHGVQPHAGLFGAMEPNDMEPGKR